MKHTIEAATRNRLRNQPMKTIIIAAMSAILATAAVEAQSPTQRGSGRNRPNHAIIEATVQRSRPVILTALAAVLAFIPLTHSVFWGSMAYVLIGGTAVGTVLALAFLPALYAIWFRVSDVERHHARESVGARLPLIG
jgi:multidrug efflux pump subunit AcrB